MGLLQNIRLIAQHPIRPVGGASASVLARTQLGINALSKLSPHTGPDWAKTASFPRGWEFGSGWFPAQAGGGVYPANLGDVIVAVTSVLNTLNLAAGRNLDTLTYPCTVTFSVPNAQLQLIVSASGNVTATFTPAGNLAGSLAAAGNTAAAFTVGSPTIGAMAGLFGNVSGVTTTSATIRATGALAGDITPFTVLSPQSLAAAVGALEIEDGKNLIEILRVCAAFAAGLTEVTDLGGGQAELIFKALDGIKDRITATMTGEERTSITLDVS